MRKFRVISAVLAATVVVGGLSACSTSNKSKNAEGSTSTGQQAASDKMKDVQLGTIAVDEYGYASVPVTITNNSSKVSNYSVDIEFTDAAGNRVDQGWSSTTNLEPGKVYKDKSGFVNTKDKGKVTAKVTKVDRYAA